MINMPYLPPSRRSAASIRPDRAKPPPEGRAPPAHDCPLAYPSLAPAGGLSRAASALGGWGVGPKLASDTVPTDTDAAPADTDAAPVDTVPADAVPADAVPAGREQLGEPDNDEEHARRARRLVNGMVRRWQADRDALNDLLGEASPYWDARPFGEETDEEEEFAGAVADEASDNEEYDTWNDGP